MRSPRSLFCSILIFKPSEPLRGDAWEFRKETFPWRISRLHSQRAHCQARLQMCGTKASRGAPCKHSRSFKSCSHCFSFLHLLRPGEMRQTRVWKILGNCPVPVKTAWSCQVSVMELRMLLTFSVVAQKSLPVILHSVGL